MCACIYICVVYVEAMYMYIYICIPYVHVHIYICMSGACACDCMPFVCVHSRQTSRHVPSARGVVHLGGGGGAETLALGNDRQYGGLTLDLYFADLVRACMRYVL